MDAPKFVTMRLGKDSVQDIRAIDSRFAGVQNPAYELTIICKQAPRSLEPGVFALLWLGSDNSKGAATEWKQGLRAVARLKDVKLGKGHNDDSAVTVSIGYIFSKSIDKIDLIDNYATAYKHFSMFPLVGLNDYANQTIREVDAGPRSDAGALIAACGKASGSPLDDLFAVYPELTELVRDSYDDSNGKGAAARPNEVGQPRNLIFFGAPGTGKSYQLNELAKDSFTAGNVRRVTFYPAYTYSQFVGCFKPITRYKDDNDGPASVLNSYISYEFVPGPFLEMYVKAVQNPKENYLLIVEEINRANPAAVFGDVFQLLDRDARGRSEYEVAVPSEMRDYLSVFLSEYATNAHISDPAKLLGEQRRLSMEAKRLSLPPNMYIWATMNSADQGVFPMDTAFKRRWDFRYMGIDEGENADVGGRKLSEIKVSCGGREVVWNNLRHAINEFMSGEDLKINEDKLLGPFFIEPSALTPECFPAVFKDKVLLYLYEDAGKTKHSKMFRKELNTYAKICKAFDKIGWGIFGSGFDDHIVYDDADDAAAEE